MGKPRKCVTLPILDEWYKPEETLPPRDGMSVVAMFQLNGWSQFGQVEYRSNGTKPEFIFAGSSVDVSHWLEIGASNVADLIEED